MMNRRNLNTQRKAFTMIELVFVIVVLGILAALALPRMDRDLRQEAKDNFLSAIRYTQHLALNDDKTNPFDDEWQKRLWQVRFSTSADETNNKAFFYTVSSDINTNGAVSKDETAIDPANGKHMYNLGGDTDIDADESPNIFVGKKYGINKMTFTGGCLSAQHIAFDNLGRPHNGLGSATNNYSQYMSQDCTIKIEFINDDITPLNITVATETGYVSAD